MGNLWYPQSLVVDNTSNRCVRDIFVLPLDVFILRSLQFIEASVKSLPRLFQRVQTKPLRFHAANKYGNGIDVNAD